MIEEHLEAYKLTTGEIIIGMVSENKGMFKQKEIILQDPLNIQLMVVPSGKGEALQMRSYPCYPTAQMQDPSNQISIRMEHIVYNIPVTPKMSDVWMRATGREKIILPTGNPKELTLLKGGK